jgi:hypothetical protein
LEVERDVEVDGVDDDGGQEVAEDDVGTGDGADDAKRYDGERDTGLPVEEGGEEDAEESERCDDNGMLPRVDVSAQVL